MSNTKVWAVIGFSQHPDPKGNPLGSAHFQGVYTEWGFASDTALAYTQSYPKRSAAIYRAWTDNLFKPEGNRFAEEPSIAKFVTGRDCTPNY